MQKAIIGKKIGMTQIFDANGKVIPVTVVEAGPCVVSQKKTVESDGYNAVQVGFGDLKANKVNKPMKGHFAKGDVAPKKTLREFRFENIDAYNVGDLRPDAGLLALRREEGRRPHRSQRSQRCGIPGQAHLQ